MGQAPVRQFSEPSDSAPKKKRGRPSKKEAVEGEAPKKPRASRKKQEAELPSTDVGPLQKMYVMKFNSPILPFAKFPLTHNKYIQDFLKQYEADKASVDTVLGVHFPQNNNKLAVDTVGIEIKITKKSSLTMIESLNTKRFQVKSFDADSNFAMAQQFEDLSLEQTFGKA